MNAHEPTRILCPIDFSDAARAGLHHASALASERDAELVLAHEGLPNEAVLTGGRALGFLHELRAQKAEAEARLEAAVPEAALDWCQVTSRAVGGTPHREIVNLADSVGADLIVVGARPRRLLDQALGATTLAALLQQADCPVLTVPASGEERAWPTITTRLDVEVTAAGIGAARV